MGYVCVRYDKIKILRKVNINNFQDYNTFIISQDDYLISREERIKYLSSCGISTEIIENKIPKEYKKIPRFICLDIITNIIKQLEKEEEFLKMAGFLEFNISGHTERDRFRPWQMAEDKRR